MDPKQDLKVAHRWFAIETNNQSWDLIEAETHREEDLAALIHIAHVSYWHWLHAGNEVNRLRALPILVFAYAMNKVPSLAVQYANDCVKLMKEVPADELSVFDTAVTFGAAAFAFQVANQKDEAKSYCEQAVHSAEMLEAEDRAVFDGLFAKRLKLTD